jgi:hypothetical protein
MNNSIKYRKYIKKLDTPPPPQFRDFRGETRRPLTIEKRKHLSLLARSPASN